MLVTVALALATACGHGHSQEHGHGRGEHDATSHRRFDDVERWKKVFDDPERDAWQRPDEVIAFLGLEAGDTVVDLGAGTGYFSVRLAPAVGPEGRVLAVDVEETLVAHLNERAAEAGIPWMEGVLTSHDSPGVEEGSADVVLIVDTWHHIGDRIHYLGKLAKALAGGGSVVVVDYREGELPIGPPPDHKLSQAHVVGEFEKAGWSLVATYDDLPYQYALKFEPGDVSETP